MTKTSNKMQSSVASAKTNAKFQKENKVIRVPLDRACKLKVQVKTQPKPKPTVESVTTEIKRLLRCMCLYYDAHIQPNETTSVHDWLKEIFQIISFEGNGTMRSLMFRFGPKRGMVFSNYAPKCRDEFTVEAALWMSLAINAIHLDIMADPRELATVYYKHLMSMYNGNTDLIYLVMYELHCAMPLEMLSIKPLFGTIVQLVLNGLPADQAAFEFSENGPTTEMSGAEMVAEMYELGLMQVPQVQAQVAEDDDDEVVQVFPEKAPITVIDLTDDC